MESSKRFRAVAEAFDTIREALDFAQENYSSPDEDIRAEVRAVLALYCLQDMMVSEKSHAILKQVGKYLEEEIATKSHKTITLEIKSDGERS